MQMDKEMTPERSLEIIRESIERSRREITRDMGTPFIMWGTLVCATALVVGHLWNHTGSAAWNWLWFVMMLIGFAGNWWINRRHGHRPESYVGFVMGTTWLSFAIFAVALPTGLYGIYILIVELLKDIVPCGTGYIIPITPAILLLMGMATTITGFILKNGWIVAGGIISGIVCTAFALRFNGAFEMLAMASAAVVGLIIPGIMINLKNKK